MFSVVIPARNEEENLPACLESVKRQAGGFFIEIIVVDNGSTDKTGQIARDFGVKVINLAELGVGRARKIGTEASQGEIVLQIDADTHLPEDYLQNIFTKFKNDPNLVCAGGRYIFYDANLFWSLMNKIFFKPLYLFSKFCLGRDIGPAANNMAFKKEAYKKAGGFRVDLKYGEDLELNARLAKIGKVELDLNLKCFVSARRFKLFQKKFWVYTVNFFVWCFWQKIYHNDLPVAK